MCSHLTSMSSHLLTVNLCTSFGSTPDAYCVLLPQDCRRGIFFFHTRGKRELYSYSQWKVKNGTERTLFQLTIVKFDSENVFSRPCVFFALSSFLSCSFHSRMCMRKACASFSLQVDNAKALNLLLSRKASNQCWHPALAAKRLLRGPRVQRE